MSILLGLPPASIPVPEVILNMATSPLQFNPNTENTIQPNPIVAPWGFLNFNNVSDGPGGGTIGYPG